MDLRTAEGFLGTGASLLSDISLIAYILLIVPGMLLGFFFARRKMFQPQHKYTMTLVVIVNWVLILYLMVASYSFGVAPRVPQDLSDIQVWLPTLHLVIGAFAQLLATYLVLRMWLERVLPTWIMVKNIKIYMRVALSGWLITALLGVSIYYIWYAAPAPATAGEGETPIVTEEPAATEDETESADATEPATTEEAVDAEEPVATEESDDAEAEEPTVTEEAENQAEEPVATEEADEPTTTEEADE